jgi:cytoskeletal protein RodZ
MNDQDQSRLQGLVIGAGGDAFIILTAIFAVLLVTANFQPSSPEDPSEPSKEKLKQKTKELSRQTRQLKSKLRRAKSRVKELSIKLSGSSSPAASENTPIYVYLRQQGGRKAGDLVVEKGERARSVRQGKLGGALRELGGRSVVLLAEPGVPSGTVTQIVDRVKGALPEASTSLGTLKK